MRLFCIGIVAARKPEPAIRIASVPPESVPLPAREQQSRHDKRRDTHQSYPDGFHDLRQNPPISEPCREVSDTNCTNQHELNWRKFVKFVSKVFADGHHLRTAT